MIKEMISPLERMVAHINERRERAQQERLTEMQFAREMRNRAQPGSVDFRYYNTIVKRCGGW